MNAIVLLTVLQLHPDSSSRSTAEAAWATASVEAPSIHERTPDPGASVAGFLSSVDHDWISIVGIGKHQYLRSENGSFRLSELAWDDGSDVLFAKVPEARQLFQEARELRRTGTVLVLGSGILEMLAVGTVAVGLLTSSIAVPLIALGLILSLAVVLPAAIIAIALVVAAEQKIQSAANLYNHGLVRLAVPSALLNSSGESVPVLSF